MRRPRTTPFSLAIAAGALVFVACSDNTTAPTSRGLSPSDPSLNVSGTNPLAIVSGNATQYCASGQLNGDITIPATYPAIAAGCTTALDLQLPAGTSALDGYNPGWSTPFTGSHWIGITTKGGPSSDYRPNVGRYVFQETFTIPANVTSPSLDLHVKGDNVAVVYLNGKQIGAQPNSDCNAAPCNWNSDLHIVDNTAADFNIGGSNTLTILVIDLPTGFPSTVAGVGGAPPQYGCPSRPFQTNGIAGFGGGPVATSPNHVVAGGGSGTVMTNIGAANQAGCENPMGLDFAGTMSWTRPPVIPIPLFVIGDVEPHGIGDNVYFWGSQWWKNNLMSATTNPPKPSDPGFQSFKGYASSADNFCGGVWSTQPGNSSNPPESIPDDVAIIVTTKVNKSGNDISGDIKQIVLVHQDHNYQDNPGHAGQGPVFQVLCTLP